MGLKLTLKPNERLIVNGCVIRNSDRRQVITIETRADVVRGDDLLDEGDAASPVRLVYFLIQTALVQADTREKLVPVIQSRLVDLTTIFSADKLGGVFEAATHVAATDFYKAMTALRPLMRHEEAVLAYSADQARRAGAGASPTPEDAREAWQ